MDNPAGLPLNRSGQVAQLLRYDQWATDRVITSLLALSDQQFHQEFGGPESSVRQQCFHLLSVCDRYRARLTLDPVPELPPIEDQTLTGAIKYHVHVRQAVEALIARIDQADLEQVVRHETRRGTFFASFGDTLLHVVNHGTYHRGQIACLLKFHGLEPAETDYILFA